MNYKINKIFERREKIKTKLILTEHQIYSLILNEALGVSNIVNEFVDFIYPKISEEITNKNKIFEINIPNNYSSNFCLKKINIKIEDTVESSVQRSIDDFYVINMVLGKKYYESDTINLLKPLLSHEFTHVFELCKVKKTNKFRKPEFYGLIQQSAIWAEKNNFDLIFAFFSSLYFAHPYEINANINQLYKTCVLNKVIKQNFYDFVKKDKIYKIIDNRMQEGFEHYKALLNDNNYLSHLLNQYGRYFRKSNGKKIHEILLNIIKSGFMKYQRSVLRLYEIMPLSIEEKILYRI